MAKTWLVILLTTLLGGCVLLGVLVQWRPPPAQQFDSVTIPSCHGPVEAVFVTDVAGWSEQVRGLPSLRPEQVISVTADSIGLMNPWTTDQWVFARRAGRPTVMSTPGTRGVTEWGADYFRTKGWPIVSLGTQREYPHSRFDAGGNVLVAPGSAGGSRTGPIITSAQMQPAIRKWLQSSSPAPLVELDTSWLKVGHVDEIVSFVPVFEPGRVDGDPENEARFRLVLPDFMAGIRLLQSVPADRVLFAAQNGKSLVSTVSASGPRYLEDASHDFSKSRWRFVRILSGRQAGLVGRVYGVQGNRLAIGWSWDLRGESPTRALGVMRDGRCETMPMWVEPPEPGSRYFAVEDSRMWLDGAGEEVPALITAGELLRDTEFLRLAKEGARRTDGPGGIQETVTRALGLQPADVVRLPVLARGDADLGNVTSLLPNPINLVCLGHDVICLKPLGPRRDPSDEASDVFLSDWQAAFRKIGLNPVFLDGWDALHRLEGGARCGMNVLRRP